MARKTALSQLNDAIAGILDEYAEDIGGNVNSIVEQMGKKGAQALRKESMQQFPTGTGEYAKGWKSQVNRERMSTTAVTLLLQLPAERFRMLRSDEQRSL